MVALSGLASTGAAAATAIVGERVNRFAGPVFVTTAAAYMVRSGYLLAYGDFILGLGLTLGAGSLYYGGLISSAIKKISPIKRLWRTLAVAEAGTVSKFMYGATYLFELVREGQTLYTDYQTGQPTRLTDAICNLTVIGLLFAGDLIGGSAMNEIGRRRRLYDQLAPKIS